MPVIKDLTGKRYGRLVVSHMYIGTEVKPRPVKWVAMCDCGNVTLVWGSSLPTGNTKSCGCLSREMSRERVYMHGMSHSKLHGKWLQIKNRCNNPNYPKYHRYGGRGIRVCEEWQDFTMFFADMNSPFEEHVARHGEANTSLDRIDVNGNYEPGNVRFATVLQQNNNRGNNYLLTHNGKTQTLAEWSRETGICWGTIRSRIKRNKWPVDKALTTKVKRKSNEH